MPLLQSGLNQLSALLTRCVAVADRRGAQRADGMAAVKSWLAGRDAAALIRDGRRLAQLPALASAYSAGEATATHVGEVTAAVTPARVAVAAANGIHLLMTDGVLTAAARALGPEDTAKAVRHWVAGIDPDGAL